MEIGFIGLGRMGYPMAGHLVAKHYSVAVYNRTADRANKWSEQYKAKTYDSIQELISQSDLLCLCVGNDADVREIITSNYGVYNHMRKSGVVIDHTTTSATLAKEMHALLAEKDISFLDCPVSGGQIGAEKGQLTIMVGGDESAYLKANPILSCYGKKISYMGKSGNGQLAKMANQICIVGVIQSLAEGIAFAVNAGLDPHKVIDATAQGSAGSWQMSNRATTMIEDKFDFGFALKLMRKDLNICLDEARRNGSELPITAIIDQFYAALENMGYSQYDASALIKLLQKKQS
jgi:3-hydroxyisobutyrate dehydrogenase-like beta-hydroxyacid dehydrogenase